MIQYMGQPEGKLSQSPVYQRHRRISLLEQISASEKCAWVGRRLAISRARPS